jgi:hypothetical protein
MTPREALLEALLVERFSLPQRNHLPKDRRQMTVLQISTHYNDDDLTTYARRKALDDACDGFDIPRSGDFRPSTHVGDVTAGQGHGSA